MGLSITDGAEGGECCYILDNTHDGRESIKAVGWKGMRGSGKDESSMKMY
jgi:hypothetical protein